jgi:putative NIF3 family GTP cyclohydrolase 1 type 2
LVIGKPNQKIKTIAWCTGAAQGYFKEAVKLGVDAYLSGEISEQTTHLARESGLAYIAAGHHATERYGVQSLGKHLQEHFGIAHYFIDIENPV